jgi:hypothetical protein
VRLGSIVRPLRSEEKNSGHLQISDKAEDGLNRFGLSKDWNQLCELQRQRELAGQRHDNLTPANLNVAPREHTLKYARRTECAFEWVLQSSVTYLLAVRLSKGALTL